MVGRASYIIFPHHGSYLVWHNMGVDPDMFGRDVVVASIPTKKDELEVWRKNCLDILSALKLENEHAKQDILKMFPKALEWKLEFEFVEIEPTHTARGLVLRSHALFFQDGDVCMTYTIDLERMVFTVDDDVHFQLADIPRGENNFLWMRYIVKDDNGYQHMRLDAAPEHCAEVYPQVPVSETGLAKYQELLSSAKVRTIESAEWVNSPDAMSEATQEFTRHIGEAMIRQWRGKFLDAYRYGPDESHFKVVADFLLRFLTPCAFRAWTGKKNFYYMARINDIESKEFDRWFESQKDQSDRKRMGRCSLRDRAGTIFELRGCLIVLSSQLTAEESLQANVGSAVLYAQEHRLESCTALLWSIRHVVAVKISDYGASVAHSAAMPVLDAFERDGEAFKLSLKLIMLYLRPPCTTVSSRRVLGKSDDRPNPCRPSVSLDVQLLVMSHADPYMYEVLGRTSRALRKEWARHPRIGQFTIRSSRYEAGQKVIYTAREGDGDLVSFELHDRQSRVCTCYHFLWDVSMYPSREAQAKEYKEKCRAHPRAIVGGLEVNLVQSFSFDERWDLDRIWEFDFKCIYVCFWRGGRGGGDTEN